MKTSGDKMQNFVRIWFSNFDHQNLSIALFVVFSFINNLIFFMEYANPIYFIFSFSNSMSCSERLCVMKEN